MGVNQPRTVKSLTDDSQLLSQEGLWGPSVYLDKPHGDKIGTSLCGSPNPDVLLNCKLMSKVVSEGALGDPKAGAGSGTVASHVAPIRCQPAQDSRATNHKLYGAVLTSKVPGHKKQRWKF